MGSPPAVAGASTPAAASLPLAKMDNTVLCVGDLEVGA